MFEGEKTDNSVSTMSSLNVSIRFCLLSKLQDSSTRCYVHAGLEPVLGPGDKSMISSVVEYGIIPLSRSQLETATDGKYLFFTKFTQSGHEDSYCVDTKIID